MSHRLMGTAAAVLLVLSAFLFAGAVFSSLGTSTSQTPSYEDAWGMFWASLIACGLGTGIIAWREQSDR